MSDQDAPSRSCQVARAIDVFSFFVVFILFSSGKKRPQKTYGGKKNLLIIH